MKTTNEICECFHTIQVDSAGTFVKEKAANCMTDAVTNNLNGLMKENKIKDLDEQGGRQLGETIANSLLKDCPDAPSVFRKVGSENAEKMK